jgi:ADP-ribosyl-[dinitrogen reductase] hydrolase
VDAKRDIFAGVLVGTAVGDAIGLPREGLPARRAAKLFGVAPLGHRLIGHRGMVSDDTEHTCMVAGALLESGGDAWRFAQSLAWRLRWWLIAIPAGVGLATMRAIVKLWVGIAPEQSGVWSAGNGPAMRAAIIGVYAGERMEMLGELVRASTVVTHTDPRALAGAMAVAVAASYGARLGPTQLDGRAYLALLRPLVTEESSMKLVARAVEMAENEAPIESVAEMVGACRGVSGFINQTVPVAIYAWMRWPGDYREAVEQVVLLGGDTDTTAAIVGGLVGATAGVAAIPVEWVSGIVEWPRSVGWMRKLASQLDVAAGGGESLEPGGGLAWAFGMIVRNVIFLIVVLLHGFRRLLPPY